MRCGSTERLFTINIVFICVSWMAVSGNSATDRVSGIDTESKAPPVEKPIGC